MDRPLEDPRALLSSARAWLEELLEEGVEGLPDPLPDPAEAAERQPPAQHASQPATAASGVSAPRTAAHGSAVATRVHAPAPGEDQASLLPAESPFGDPASLESVRAALGECTRCRLHEGRQQIVFGDGNPHAELLFVGEGPGAEEDRRGLPFVGRAGELLTQMIEKGLGIPRSEVYICNIVKCRPPDNRTPLADEAATCRPFLDGQIAAVRPRVIVALGKPATSLLLGRDVAITRVRGTWHDYKGIPLMPTYHPAFILRQYTPENRRLVWEDLKAALARVRELP